MALVIYQNLYFSAPLVEVNLRITSNHNMFSNAIVTLMSTGKCPIPSSMFEAHQHADIICITGKILQLYFRTTIIVCIQVHQNILALYAPPDYTHTTYMMYLEVMKCLHAYIPETCILNLIFNMSLTHGYSVRIDNVTIKPRKKNLKFI
jgi:hypothetical protein